MIARALLAASVVLLLGSPARGAEPVQGAGAQAAVVVIGGNPADAGTMQNELVERMGGSGRIRTVSTSDLAGRLGVPEPKRRRSGTRDALRRLEMAKAAHSFGKTEEAIELMELATAAEDVAPADKIRLHLWQATFLLAGEHAHRADRSIASALELDPAHRVSDEFPPTVKMLADAMRKALPVHRLRIGELPVGVEVRIDDRRIRPGETLLIAPGTREAEFSGGGFRAVARSVKVFGDTVLEPPHLAPHLAPTKESFLDSAVRSDSTDPGKLGELAQAAGADALVVVALGEGRADALVWTSHDPANASTAAFGNEDAAALAEWAAATIVAAIPPPPSPYGEWKRHLSSGPAFAVWNRRIRASSGFDAGQGTLQGTGATVLARLSRGRLAGGLDLSAISFQATRTSVREAGTQSGTIVFGSAGALLRGDAHAMVHAIDRDGFDLEAGLGAVAEHYDVSPLIDGYDLPFFVSYWRLAPDVRAEARYRFGRFTLRGGTAVSPAGVYAETPTSTTGGSPWPVSATANLLAEARLGSRWKAGIAYEGELRHVRFRGRARKSFDLPLRDGTLFESLHVLGLNARIEF